MTVESPLLYEVPLTRGCKTKSQTNKQATTIAKANKKPASIGRIFIAFPFFYGKMFLGILDGSKRLLHRAVLPLPHVSTTKSSVIFGCLLNPRPPVFWMR